MSSIIIKKVRDKGLPGISKMSSIIIKKAKYKDLQEICVLQKVSFYEVGKFNNNFSIRPLHETIDEFQSNFKKYYYCIAKENSSIIGSARGIFKDDCCKIENVIVHPEYQKRGIGRILVEDIEKAFPKVERFVLFTGKNTPGNVDFYKKLNYKIFDEVPATKKEPILVYMEKFNYRNRIK